MIFTNGRHDTIRNAFYQYSDRPCGVLLACPFFSNSSLVRELLQKGCSVRLVVRLSEATHPDELRIVMKLQVPVRYFTSSRFHSKLYIFSEDVALVGSANLTDSGVQSNQEICIGVDGEDPRYERLVQAFQSYWDQAQPLDFERLNSFAAIVSANRGGRGTVDSKILAILGDIAPTGIQVDVVHRSREQVYLADYERVYQEFLHAFRIVQEVYQSSGRQKQPDVPLRLEIDQFFSFIRQEFTTGESYLEAPLRHGQNLEQNIRTHIEQWLDTNWVYLDRTIPENYKLISSALGSPESISNSGYDELLDALLVCHSFNEQLRFHKGAIPALRRDFMRDNELGRAKRTLIYLLFGGGNFIERMGNCIFNPEYALSWFGRSCVQETFGWVNGEDIPICNGRTVKSLRYLGFQVKIFN
ncbi:MAG: phospholipase D family protein [Alphaproteobacteria bacterium]|nr:phospholipase D family protein [Alphaproteobacteria bacterium]